MLGRLLLETRRRYSEIKVYISGTLNKIERETRFVIFGPGRSGSTLLVKLINSNPAVYCDMEELGIPRLLPLTYLDCRSHSNVSIKSVYGFKMQHNHLELQNLSNEKAVIDGFLKNNWKFIFLWRRNLLRQALSLQIARERGVWFTNDTSKQLDKVIVDPGRLLELVKQIDNSHKIYRSLLRTTDYLELNYEDDLFDESRQRRSMSKIAVFLNIGDDFSINPDIKKTVGINMLNSVSNWEEISMAFEESEFSELLTEFSLL